MGTKFTNSHLWAVAFSAAKVTDHITISVGVLYVDAESHAQALGKGILAAEAQYPRAEGYYDHQASVTEISQEAIDEHATPF